MALRSETLARNGQRGQASEDSRAADAHLLLSSSCEYLHSLPFALHFSQLGWPPSHWDRLATVWGAARLCEASLDLGFTAC